MCGFFIFCVIYVAVNSPLLGEKREFRWVLKPLELQQHEDEFVFPEVFEPPVEQHAEETVHMDKNLHGWQYLVLFLV